MASLTITVDDTIVPRILLAYDVVNAGQLKNAIIEEVRAKVIRYEFEQKIAVENEKIRLVEEAKQTAVQQAKADAESQIILT